MDTIKVRGTIDGKDIGFIGDINIPKEDTTYEFTPIQDLFDDDYRKLVAEIKADNEKMMRALHKINVDCTERNLNYFCNGLFDALMNKYDNDTYKVLRIADVILDIDRGL